MKSSALQASSRIDLESLVDKMERLATAPGILKILSAVSTSQRVEGKIKSHQSYVTSA